MKVTEESLPRVGSSVPWTHQDPRDLELICLVKQCIIRFRILSVKKRTLKFDFYIVQFEYQLTFPSVQQCHIKKDSKLNIYYD